jgi:hypothetical protein
MLGHYKIYICLVAPIPLFFTYVLQQDVTCKRIKIDPIYFYFYFKAVWFLCRNLHNATSSEKRGSLKGHLLFHLLYS